MTQVFEISSRQVLALIAVTLVTAVGVVLAFNVSTAFAAGFGNNNNNHNHDNHHDNNHGGQCTYNDNHNFHYHHHNGGGDNTGSTTPDSLTIEKDTVGGDGTFSFDITGGDSSSTPQNVQVTTTAGQGDSSTYSLDDGTYTISEEAAAGWTLSDITCQDGNGDVAVTPVGDTGAQISLSGGDDVTCAFTNTSDSSDASNGQITLVKNTVGGDGVFPFSITGPDSFSDSPSITTSSSTGTMSETGLEAGAYTLTENVPSGWTLTGTSCTFDAGSTGSSTTNGESITLGSAGAVTCTFTDTMASSTATSTGGDTGGNGGSGGNGGGAPQSNVVFGSGGGNPGVSGGGSTGSTGGQVLGAETGPNSCVPPLTGYIRAGWKNNPEQVEALQAFLNQNMGTELQLSGVYNTPTEDVVNGFQLKYFQDVLAPWVKYGLPTDHTPTGYVYKLTEWKVNSLACPDNTIPEPQIP